MPGTRWLRCSPPRSPEFGTKIQLFFSNHRLVYDSILRRGLRSIEAYIVSCIYLLVEAFDVLLFYISYSM